MKLTPFLGAAIAATTLLSACNGTTPSGTGVPAGTPGFSVHLTKNGTNLSGRTVFLKSFNGGTEGSLTGGTAVAGSSVTTDGNGNAFVAAQATAVTAGALFGVGYDASNSNFGGNATKQDASQNSGEIQWFSTPAFNLATKTGLSASVNIDVAWNTQAFSPAYSAAVQGPSVNFTVPAYTGATSYEWDINAGSVAGSGQKANGSGLTSNTTSATWTAPSSGSYVYQVKAFTASGVAGGSGQTAAPWVLFSVQNAQ